MQFNTTPVTYIDVNDVKIPSFLDALKSKTGNIDPVTVGSFGDEWHRFSTFSPAELKKISDDYFDIVDESIINGQSTVLDVGCGSGRWSKVLAPKVKKVEAIDPSEAVLIAAKMLKDDKNVRVSQASTDHIPFPDDSFDFVMSLGVLHHIPDTFDAIKKCVAKVRPGGHFLVYLYYALENRSLLYRTLFHLVNMLRQVICRLPAVAKNLACDLLALTVYLPLARLGQLVSHVNPKLASRIPLSYYGDKSFYIMRNDSLDRFGTPLEQRFSKEKIHSMLEQAGLKDIRFSDRAPYWHAIGKK
jgi:SAM-dependent methyltransferase